MPNSAPVTMNDTYVVAPNSGKLTMRVLANDYDPDGDSFKIDSWSTDSHYNALDRSDTTVWYTPEKDFVGAVHFQYTVKDSRGARSEYAHVSIVVDNAPRFASASAEMGLFEGYTQLSYVTATDPDAGAVLTYKIVGGADAAKFLVNRSTGQLSFTAAPDYEARGSASGSNDYFVEVEAADQYGLSAAQTISVKVYDLNEAPVVNAPAEVLRGATGRPVIMSGPRLVSLSDGDGDVVETLKLISTHGDVSIVNTPGVTISQGSSTWNMTLTGKVSALNRALETMWFRPDEGFAGRASLRIEVNDAPSANGRPALSASTTLQFDIGNLPPALSAGPASATLVEASPLDAGRATAELQMSASDPDGVLPQWVTDDLLKVGDTRFQARGAYGTFTLDTSTGRVTYALDNNAPATAALAPGVLVTDTQTFSVTDGRESASAAATFTIRGSHPDAAGGAGDDNFIATAANNVIDGAAGMDTVSFADASAGVVVDLRASGPQNTGGSGVDTLRSIERLVGSSFADVLTGTDGDNLLTGGAGGDTLSGGFGLDILYGNQGDDVLFGNQDNDIVYGGQGDDVAYGGQGDDALFGNLGNDQLSGNLGNDVLNGGAGANRMDGGDGSDTASYADAGAGVTVSLMLAGTAQATGVSSDTLVGIENLTGGAFADVLTGDGAANLLAGGAGADSLFGGFGGDTLYGNQDDDVLYGNQDNDQLFGGQGRDVLYGGQGDDLLFGNAGADALYGNLGADTFTYASVGDSPWDGVGGDVIADFSSAQGDRIDLRRVHTGAGDNFAISASGGSTYLEVHTTAGDMLIILTGYNVLTRADVLWT